MGRFEAALVRAEAKAGIVPPNAAEIIGRRQRLASSMPRLFPAPARASGTIAIPFVEMLTARVAEADAAAASFVHRGTTSQDVSDTAIVLCLREAARSSKRITTD